MEKVYLDQGRYRLTSTALTVGDRSFDVDAIDSVIVRDHRTLQFVSNAFGIVVPLGALLWSWQAGSIVVPIVATPMLIFGVFGWYRLLRNGATTSVFVFVSGKKYHIFETPDAKAAIKFRDLILAAKADRKLA